MTMQENRTPLKPLRAMKMCERKLKQQRNFHIEAQKRLRKIYVKKKKKKKKNMLIFYFVPPNALSVFR